VARARDNLTYVMVVLYLTQAHTLLYNTQFYYKSGRRSAAEI